MVLPFLLLLAGFPAAAGEPDDPSALVAQLADARFEVREEAQRRLLEIGDAAREALVKAAAGDDAEQRLRVQYLLREIRRGEAWRPGRVTLRMRDAPVLDVFKAVAEQTSNPINWSRTPRTFSHRVTVDWQGVDYWTAMDELSRNSRVAAWMFDDPERGGVVLAHGQAGRAPTAVDGPLRLRLATAGRQRSHRVQLTDGGVDAQDECDLGFTLNWEQPFALCRYVARPRVRTAVTDAGEELRIEPRSASSPMHVSRQQRQLPLTVALRPPTKPAKKLSRLDVELDLTAAVDFRVLSIDGWTEGALAADEGYELELVGSTKGAAHREIVVRIGRPTPFDKMNSTDLVDEYLEVVDAAGKPLAFAQQQVIGDALQVKYVLRAVTRLGEPAGLRFHVAVLKSRRSVVFPFRDVELPGLLGP
ncbi:MAG: hypothetical protein ACRC1K_26305 [Planctomycetia bacterium]